MCDDYDYGDDNFWWETFRLRRLILQHVYTVDFDITIDDKMFDGIQVLQTMFVGEALEVIYQHLQHMEM